MCFSIYITVRSKLFYFCMRGKHLHFKWLFKQNGTRHFYSIFQYFQMKLRIFWPSLLYKLFLNYYMCTLGSLTDRPTLIEQPIEKIILYIVKALSEIRLCRNESSLIIYTACLGLVMLARHCVHQFIIFTNWLVVQSNCLTGLNVQSWHDFSLRSFLVEFSKN